MGQRTPIKFQFPPNGKVRVNEGSIDAQLAKVLVEKFQFPPNGKVRVNGDRQDRTGRAIGYTEVSIPSKREGTCELS